MLLPWLLIPSAIAIALAVAVGGGRSEDTVLSELADLIAEHIQSAGVNGTRP